jgi:hypothetical protein
MSTLRTAPTPPPPLSAPTSRRAFLRAGAAVAAAAGAVGALGACKQADATQDNASGGTLPSGGAAGAHDAGHGAAPAAPAAIPRRTPRPPTAA